MGFQDAFAAYYAIAALSALCSLFVCFTLWLFASLKTTATQLLLILHFTLLCEEVCSLPFIFAWNRGLCATIAFFHFYAGFANAISIGLLVISYRYHFMDDTFGLTNLIQKYSLHFVTIIPLITLLPFITNSYSNDNDVWCTMKTSSRTTNVWAFCTFYGWAWLILNLSTLVLVITMYQVYIVDREIGMKLFSTTGMYAIIAILSWLPRTAIRFWNVDNQDEDNTALLFAYFPVYISGILYTVVFLREKKALLLFDRLSDWAGSDLDVSMSFSWEDTAVSNLYYTDVAGSRSRVSSHVSNVNPDYRSVSKAGVYTPLISSDRAMEDYVGMD